MKIDKNTVDELISQYLPVHYSDLLDEMSKYSLYSGGKRVRPIMLLTTASCFGDIDDNIKRLAAALECIHTYSLVHDDLPSMDNDQLRRGKPTAHIKYGEANAILCGDYLINCSMEILSGGNGSNNYFECISYLYKQSAMMISGQIKDIAGNIDNLDSYLDMASCKTSALIRASMVIPAIYYNLDSCSIESLSGIATNCGIIYQIADDLDEGKAECSTILSFCDRKSAVELLQHLKTSTMIALDEFEDSVCPLPHIRQLIDSDTKFNLNNN